MTADASKLASCSPSPRQCHILEVDGTPLYISGQGKLPINQFTVPYVLHGAKLAMNLLSVRQLADHNFSVTFDALLALCGIVIEVLLGIGRHHNGVYAVDHRHVPSTSFHYADAFSSTSFSFKYNIIPFVIFVGLILCPQLIFWCT